MWECTRGQSTGRVRVAGEYATGGEAGVWQQTNPHLSKFLERCVKGIREGGLAAKLGDVME